MPWSRDVSSPRLYWSAGAAAALALVVGVAGPGAVSLLGLVLAVVALWLLAQARTRVVVDDRGVRVEQPLLRRTLTAAPIEEIERTDAGRLDPHRLALGGYGVLRIGRTSGFRATRDGDILELGLTGGRTFVVTVPDPGEAAALLTAALARRGTPDGDDDACPAGP